MDDFFNEDQLVQNLAFLLGIDESQIRVVNVVTETISKRRRRQGEGSGMMSVMVDFEIGNPPAAVVTMDTTNNDTTPDNDTMSGNDTQTTPTDPTLSFDELEDLAEMLVDVIQTGQLTSDLNATVVNAVVMEPEPEPVDLTNGTRATPETGGPQPGENGTETLETFSDMQLRLEEEEENETQPIIFTIPTRLSIEGDIGESGEEGRPLDQQPIIVMFDNMGRVIQNLGLDEAWSVAVVVEQGPSIAFLSNNTADLINGRAEFSGLQLSYPGNYKLSFVIVFPESANFSVTSEVEVTVYPRELALEIRRQPGGGNTSLPLYPYPAVELWEEGALLSDHDWRNTSWFVRATLQRNGQSHGSWEVQLDSGYAEFTEIVFPEAGQYSLVFSVFTEPPSSHIPASVTSQTFSVVNRPLTRLNLTFDEDYDTVIGENDEYLAEFEAVFLSSFMNTFPTNFIEVNIVSVTSGSIVVTISLTSIRAQDLLEYVQTVTTSNGTLVFTFRDIELSPSAIVQDPDYPIELIVQDPDYPIELPEDSEDDLTLILVSIIPAASVLLATLLTILIVTLCYRHRRNSQSFKVSATTVEKCTPHPPPSTTPHSPFTSHPPPSTPHSPFTSRLPSSTPHSPFTSRLPPSTPTFTPSMHPLYHTFQIGSAARASSGGGGLEHEGKYVQHNMGLAGAEGDMEEYFLINETEKRLDESRSTLSFQSFQMKERPASSVSKVRIRHSSSCVYSVVTSPPFLLSLSLPPSLPLSFTPPLSLSLQHEPVVVSKEITVPGGSVFVNPSVEKEEVGKYVAKPTKPATTRVGGLQNEVDEILIKSGSFRGAESKAQ